MTIAVPAQLGSRRWTAVIVLGFVGQLAWTVENMYLNVFLYDTISDDPTAIATMVAASAVTATVATLLIGSLSDRTGRRRVFIAAGYVLWGLSTAAFGLVTVDTVANLAPAANAVLVAMVAVIVLDCVMSFLGSGANDAAFQAWVTDVTRLSPTGAGWSPSWRSCRWCRCWPSSAPSTRSPGPGSGGSSSC
ncbi:MFS transporter [Nonomuraea ferruginea]